MGDLVTVVLLSPLLLSLLLVILVHWMRLIEWYCYAEFVCFAPVRLISQWVVALIVWLAGNLLVPVLMVGLVSYVHQLQVLILLWIWTLLWDISVYRLQVQ